MQDYQAGAMTELTVADGRAVLEVTAAVMESFATIVVDGAVMFVLDLM